MLHGISWWQFIGGYLAIYVIIIAIVLFKKLPQLLQNRKSLRDGNAPATLQSVVTSSPTDQVPVSPVEKAKQLPIWQQPPPVEPAAALSETEMYDMASLALDDLDELFGACVAEEWTKEELVKNLHRKLQSYLRLINTKMYSNISSYIEHQALAVSGIELSMIDVASLW